VPFPKSVVGNSKPMSSPSCRFLHAHDLMLDTPLQGFGPLPEELEQIVGQAPRRTADKTFQKAIELGVDFVLLTGQLLDLRRAEPALIRFLQRQFEVLAAARIPVYWVGSAKQFRRWPRWASLPPEVHWLSQGKTALKTNGFTCEISLLDSTDSHADAADGSADQDEPAFRIRVVAAAEKAELRKFAAHHRGDYWALAQAKGRRTLLLKKQVAHAPGSPQARFPDAAGPHGCTRVELMLGHRPRLQFIATASVQFYRQKLLVPESGEREPLLISAHQCLSGIGADGSPDLILINWELVASPSLKLLARAKAIRQQFLEEINRMGRPAKVPIWSLDAQWQLEDPRGQMEAESFASIYLDALYSLYEERLHDSQFLEELASAGELGRWLRANGATCLGAERLAEAIVEGLSIVGLEDRSP